MGEATFLAGLIRLMTLLLPNLKLLKESDDSIKYRFHNYVNVIVSTCDNCPFVVNEGISFYKRLSHQPDSTIEDTMRGVVSSDNIKTTLYSLIRVISPDNYQAFKHNGNVTSPELDGSPLLQKAAIDCLFSFSSETSNYFTWENSQASCYN